MFINKYLIKFTGTNKGLVFVACLYDLSLVAINTLISLLGAIAIRMILGETSVLVFTHVMQPFLCIAIGLILRYLLTKRKVIAANECSAQIKMSLRMTLLKVLFDLGPGFLIRRRTGDIANIISNKVEWLSHYYTTYLPTLFSAVVNAVILIGILLYFDWITALICFFACVGMLVLPVTAFYKKMKETGDKQWAVHTAYYSDCLDSIQGMTTLKSFNANGQRREYMQNRGEELRRSVMNHLKVTTVESGVLELLARIGSALSVAVAVVRSIGADGNMQNLVYVLFIAGACFAPMLNIVNAWHMGSHGVTASYSIAEMLAQKSKLPLAAKDGAVAVDATSEYTPAISFQDVSFSYNKEDGDVLHHISFNIPSRTMTALVGPSGSGKSTIAHLLAGFYPVGTGSIQVGEMEMSEETVGTIQQMISAVWQDSHIFYGTVMENIRMGRQSATDDEVIDAAKKANLHEFVISLPDGYKTFLGENGMLFSGGERQRISLARSFLKDSPILLFDEATSSLDRKNEMEIQQSFLKLRQGKTSFVIAHRLATIQQADQICIIDGGKIVDVGTHEQLLKTSVAYQALMGDQSGQKEGE